MLWRVSLKLEAFKNQLLYCRFLMISTPISCERDSRIPAYIGPSLHRFLAVSNAFVPHQFQSKTHLVSGLNA